MGSLGHLFGFALRRAGIVLFLASLMLMLASFAGRFHPIGDSFAVFRWFIALLILFSGVLVLQKWRRLIAGGVLAAAFFIEPIIAGVAPMLQPQPGPIALYQKNLWYLNRQLDALEHDIRAQSPDMIVMQEVSLANMAIFDNLAASYATSLYCGGRGIASIAILTRFPRTAEDSICMESSGIAAVRVQAPSGPVWIVGIHLRWPWPKTQPQNVKDILPVLESLDGTVVVAGDFNAVPWSDAMSRIRAATRTERVGPVYRTLVGVSPYLRIPIDHVLTPGGNGHLETRPLLGSDHLGLVARFDL